MREKTIRPIILDLDESFINNLLIIAKSRDLEEEEYKQRAKSIANALDLDFLEFEELEVDYLEEDENMYVTGLDIDFLEQNFLADILKQINEELQYKCQMNLKNKKELVQLYLVEMKKLVSLY